MFESCWAHHLTSSGGFPTMTLVQAATRFARREHVRIMLAPLQQGFLITSTVSTRSLTERLTKR